MTTGRQHREQTLTTHCVRSLGLTFFTLLLLVVALEAQTRKPTEFQVKAVYLFNFGKFVKWPAPAHPGKDTFSICVLGGDPFGRTLDSTVAGERIDGRRVNVRRISAAAEAGNCRIVFVSSSEQGRVSSVIATLAQQPVLTVSDMEGFVDRHGMIGFVMDHDRVRFEVNLSAAEKAGLTLSSELLKVATSVKREGQPGQ